MKRFAIAALFGAVASSQASLLSYGAALDPRFEVGHAITGADSMTNGAVGFTIDDVTGDIRGTITGLSLSSTVTGFHIHIAPVGFNGPIAADLAALPRYFDNQTVVNGRTYATFGFVGNVNSVLRNGATFSGLLTALATGNAYSNMHTSINPAGEIRGQLAETQAVPEPATMTALSLGAVSVWARRRNRK